MPLPIARQEPLDIPESAFNADGLAVIMLPGGRYGGNWLIKAVDASTPDKATRQPAGEFWTSLDDRNLRALESDPAYSDRAIETAFIWLVTQAGERGWRVVAWECFNSQYGEAERPYFCLARATVASEKFTPAPGVTYADEIGLDAALIPGDPS
jgi:hypothetical protein